MIEETIPAALAGERLDRVVALVAGISRSDAGRALAAGAVSVDGEVVAAGKTRLDEGATVTIDPTVLPGSEPPQPDPDVAFGVVHADDAIIVVDKPPGLVVHPGAGNPDGTLVNGLLARFDGLADVGDEIRPGIVHRLDAGSSGLLVVARTTVAAERLVEQFAAHRATRIYRAVVWGVPESPHGVIDAPLGRSRSNPVRMAVVADGRFARTDYRVERSFRSPAALSLLRCRLETGRTHQIRVHLESIGHPLVGDRVYGRGRPSLGLQRPFLHASTLSFRHPTTETEMTFESPLAPDLAEWLSELEE